MIQLNEITYKSLHNFSATFSSKGLYVILEDQKDLLDVLTLEHEFIGNYLYNQNLVTTKENLIGLSYINKSLSLIDTLTVGDNFALISDNSDLMYNTVNRFTDLSLLNKQVSDLTILESRIVLILTALLKQSSVLLIDDYLSDLDDSDYKSLIIFLKDISQDHLVIIQSSDIRNIEQCKNIIRYNHSYKGSNTQQKITLHDYKHPDVKLYKFFDKDKSNTSSKGLLFFMILLSIITALFSTNIDQKLIDAYQKEDRYNKQPYYGTLEEVENNDDVLVTLGSSFLFELADAKQIKDYDYWENDIHYESIPEDDYYWKLFQAVDKGRLPENENEIALGANYFWDLKHEYSEEPVYPEDYIGQEISLRILDEERNFTVVGILNSFTRRDVSILSIGNPEEIFYDQSVFFHHSLFKDFLEENKDLLTSYPMDLYFKDFDAMMDQKNANLVSKYDVLYKYGYISLEPLLSITRIISVVSAVISFILLFKFMQKQILSVQSKPKNLSQLTFYGYSFEDIKKGLLISKVKELSLIIFGVLLLVINIILIFEFLDRMDYLLISYLHGNYKMILTITLLVIICSFLYIIISILKLKIVNWDDTKIKHTNNKKSYMKILKNSFCFLLFLFLILFPFNSHYYALDLENTELSLSLNLSYKSKEHTDYPYITKPLRQIFEDGVYYGEILDDFNIYEEKRFAKMFKGFSLLDYGVSELNDDEVLVSNNYIKNILHQTPSSDILNQTISIPNDDQKYTIVGILSDTHLTNKYIYTNQDDLYSDFNIVYVKESALNGVEDDQRVHFKVFQNILDYSSDEINHLDNQLMRSDLYNAVTFMSYNYSLAFYPIVVTVLSFINLIIFIIIHNFIKARRIHLREDHDSLGSYLFDDYKSSLISLLISGLMYIGIHVALELLLDYPQILLINTLFGIVLIAILLIISRLLTYRKLKKSA